MAAERNSRTWERLSELIWGCAISQAIHVSIELGIPEILNAGPKSADELAAATGADAWTLETVLRALAACEVLRIEGEDKFALTQVGRLLLSWAGPLRSKAEGGEFFETIYRSLGALNHMVKTGEIAFDRVYGKSFYDHLAEKPALAAHFYDSMEANATKRYAGLFSIFDFSGVSRVVDVGGGEGSLLVQILQEHRDVKGVVFDLPMVADRSRARIEAAGLTDRCEIVSGDFRNSVPSGGNLYVLAQVLNNLRDEEAHRVLANCRAVMDDNARLLVLEQIYGALPHSRWRALLSLGVMAQRGGRSRSEGQLRSLLSAAGFHVEEITQIPSNPIFAIKAKPVV